MSVLLRGWHTGAERTLVTSLTLPFSFFFSSFPHTLISLPLSLSHPSLSLSCPHSHLCLSLSPKIGPAVHQPSRSSPSCLPSPNEKPLNNTGHRSRERTGCAHNGPVAPSKTIVPFFLFLRCCQDWKRQTFGEVSEGRKEVLLDNKLWGPRLFYNCLKGHNDKHLDTPPLALTSPSFHSATLPPFVWFKSHHAL